MADHALPCGCRSCGCICADHSPSRLDLPCSRHATSALARWIAGDLAAIGALALLIALAAVLA